MTADFLATMAEASHARARAAERLRSRESLLAAIAESAPPPRLTLSSRGFDVVAEVKLRSPAAGVLRDSGSEDVARRSEGYAAAGAAAISILTEPERFDGDLEHLRQGARAVAAVPVMRKDFLVNDYQLLEARAAGAGGVLLIVRMLSSETLLTMLQCALDQQLFVLLEVFAQADVDAAVNAVSACGDRLWWAPRMPRIMLGVNCRDLTSLQVVPARLEHMVQALPTELPRVAESGLVSPNDAARLAAAGYDLALVGSALMRAESPGGLLRDMLEAGRLARSSDP